MTRDEINEVLETILDVETAFAVSLCVLGSLSMLLAGEFGRASYFAYLACMVGVIRLACSIAFHYVDRWHGRAIERIRKGGS